MSTNSQSVVALLTPHQLAIEITQLFTEWKNARTSWEQEMLEIRTFLYATDTRTVNQGLENFKNSTTIPKLSQIATNLLANYDSHLFSEPDWAQFEAHDEEAATAESRRNVEAYVRTKVRRKEYESKFREMLTHWINTGVCYGQQRYVTEKGMRPDGTEAILYQGPVLDVIHPMNIVWDITAASFNASAKIVREVFTLGDIARDIEENSQSYFTPEMLEKMRTTRMAVRSSGIKKAPEGVDWEGIGLTQSGFGDLLNYMKSDMVEVLTYYGDMYNVADGTFRKNHKIVIADRMWVVHDQEITTENGSDRLYYAGWEDLPDSRMAMSPLARIVGLQYKLDKLENLRADIFDRIANPERVEIGTVEHYGVRGGPDSRYVVEDIQGDVKYLNPPVQILNADFQIQNTMNIMEMMAGSPQNASGFRTPGEKTKFEVQVLDQGANRIFRNKTKKFEKEMIEPVLEDIVAMGRENIGETDMVSTFDDIGTQLFLNISRDDLFVAGKIRARGSQLFAEKANTLQNLLGILASPAAGMLAPHISTEKLSGAMAQLAGVEEFGIFVPFIGVQEQARIRQLNGVASGQVAEAEAMDATDQAVAAEQELREQE